MRKLLIILGKFAQVSVLILVAFLISSRPSQACTTIQAAAGTVPADTTEALVKKANMILEGTVLATTPNFGGGENYAYVKVARYFKAENGLSADKSGIYLHFICGGGMSIKSGQKGIFFAVSANSTTGSIEPISLIREESLTPKVTAKIIEAVGHNPIMPQVGGAVPDLSATFKADGLNTPGVPFIQITTIISFVSNFSSSPQIVVGFPLLIIVFGICILLFLVGVIAWLGSKPSREDKS